MEEVDVSKDAQGMTVCNVDCPRVSYIRLPLSRVEGIKGIALYDGNCQLAAEEDNARKRPIHSPEGSHSDADKVLGEERKAVNKLKRGPGEESGVIAEQRNVGVDRKVDHGVEGGRVERKGCRGRCYTTRA
jgi:hypothetical protein